MLRTPDRFGGGLPPASSYREAISYTPWRVKPLPFLFLSHTICLAKAPVQVSFICHGVQRKCVGLLDLPTHLLYLHQTHLSISQHHDPSSSQLLLDLCSHARQPYGAPLNYKSPGCHAKAGSC
jgi:hypothetical protein